MSRYQYPTSLLLVCLCIVTTPEAHAAKYAGEFMRLGLGARAWGMGGASVANASDATAIYWNPANLALQSKRDIMLMHAETFGSELNYDALAFGMPSRKSAKPLGVGFALFGLSGGNINRTQLADPSQPISPGNQPQIVETVGHGDWALYAGVGKGISPKWNLGASLKLVYRDLVDVTAVGFGLDAGATFQPSNVWTFAATVYDLTTTLLAYDNGTKEYVNPRAALGLALTPDWDRFRLTLQADGVFEFEGRQEAAQFYVGSISWDLRWGAEILYRSAVALRGGMNAENPTLGVGVRFGNFSVDGAWRRQDILDDSYRVSISHAW